MMYRPDVTPKCISGQRIKKQTTKQTGGSTCELELEEPEESVGFFWLHLFGGSKSRGREATRFWSILNP